MATPAERELAAAEATLGCAQPKLRLALERPKVGVGALLFHPSRSPPAVLVGARRGSHGAGLLALPGGHLERGEAWGECAAREVEEEAGVALHAARWAPVAATNAAIPRAAGEPLHYVTLFVAARASAAEAAAVTNAEPDKCEGWEWADAAGLAAAGAGRLFLPLELLLRAGGAAALERAAAAADAAPAEGGPAGGAFALFV